jgi:hypothetical protein
MPVLFTQNFKFRNQSSGESLSNMIGLEPRALPFGDEKGIVIMSDGYRTILEGTNANPASFNPAGATNIFLWPLSSGQDLSGR